MTFSTTHLGIGTLVVFFLSPKSIKESLKNRPIRFFIISLGAIIPDLDLFTSGHRAYAHTIFAPLLIILIAQLVTKNSDDFSQKRQDIILFGIFWLTHIIFDTTFGPMAIFWPIDPRFYDIQMGIRFFFEGFWIFPIAIFLFIKVSIIDQKTGIQTFFINWTPEERVSVFGSVVDLPLMDFMIHISLFLWYLGFVLFPAVQKITSRYLPKELISNFKQQSSNYIGSIRRYKGKILTVFVLILIIGSSLTAGPLGGKQWTDKNSSSSRVWVLHDTVLLITEKTFSVPENAELNVDVTVQNNKPVLELFAIVANKSISNEVNDFITKLLNKLDQGNISHTQMVLQYQSYMKNNLSLAENNIIRLEEYASEKWEFSSKKDITILAGLYSWNVTKSFVQTIQFTAVWNIDRTQAYWVGAVNSVLFLIILLLVILQMYSKKGVNEQNLDETIDHSNQK